MDSMNLMDSKKYDGLIWENLYEINSKRVKNLSLILLLITLFLFAIDFYNKSEGLWSRNYGYVLLFYTHILLFLGLCAFLIVYLINKNDHSAFFHKFYFLGFCFFLLDYAALTSGYVDQLIHGQITVFSMACFIIAILFNLKPKHAVLLFLQSYLFFISLLNTIQQNGDSKQGNYGNAFIIILVVSFISMTITKLMQRDYLIRYKLEDIVKERTEALIKKQQEVNRLQQFNLIGEMAAGIAHEIRNPITAVRGFLQLLGDREYNNKDKDHFNLMIEELDRANSIITDFLSLTKSKKVTLEKKNLNSIISALIPLIDININLNQTLRLKLLEIPDLLLDEKEIRQVILNLTKNGSEAMPCGGYLTIKTFQLCDEVILEIQDEGIGIEPDLLDKVGTPFYTTKDTGTGLGLAVSQNIINQHKGSLEIESSSKGSSFRVIFKIA